MSCLCLMRVTLSWQSHLSSVNHQSLFIFLVCDLCYHYHHHHHHQILLLIMEHRASMKGFQALRSPAIPLTWRASRPFDLQLSLWPHSMIFLCFLFQPLLSFATFSSVYLFFCIPEDSNLMQFSLLPLLLWVMCVQICDIHYYYLLLPIALRPFQFDLGFLMVSEQYSFPGWGCQPHSHPQLSWRTDDFLSELSPLADQSRF